MNKTRTFTRRDFFKTAAAAVTTFNIVPRRLLGGPHFVPPSETVNVALIGAGGQGRTNLRKLFLEPSAQVIAIADPAESFSLEKFYYKGMGGRKPVKAEIEKNYGITVPNFHCAEYEDFRVMLEKEKSIDAVLIATPDHQHAYISVACMQSGKHVYCEKPLTHNLWEARRVAEVAKSTGVATQMGNIGHSTDTIRETCEWLQAGAIGTVREVHAWVGTKRWNPTLIGKPTDTPPVPAGLNWDLWLGPRDPRPYNPAYFPVAWRDFWAFGGSSIGDFGCHDLDSACWALDLQSPETVEFSAAGPTDAEIAPHGSIGYYHFAPRGERGPIKITWYDGGLVPERPQGLPEKEKLPSRGVLFVGDKGEMLCGGAGGPARLLPQEKMDAFKKPAPTIERSHGHHRDWLEACKGGQAASSNFAYGARLTELTLLGVLSLRTGKKIAWDPANLKAKGLPEADAIIREKYRAGWEVG